jgi:hypothetical protein
MAMLILANTVLVVVDRYKWVYGLQLGLLDRYEPLHPLACLFLVVVVARVPCYYACNWPS